MGPLSKDGGTFGWGGKAVELFAAGARARLSAVQSVFGGLGAPQAPLGGVSAPSAFNPAVSVASAHASAASAFGGDTYQTTLVIPASPPPNGLQALERASFYQRSGILEPEAPTSMNTGGFVTGLTYDGTDLVPSDGSFVLWISKGLNDAPEVRGQDVTVPALTGQVARNRVANRLPIELSGWVLAQTDPVSAGVAQFRQTVRALQGAV